MAGKSGRSINNVPESPVKKMIFSWEGILVLLFIAVNIFCAMFSEYYNLSSLLRQMPVYLAEVFMMLPMAYILVLGEIDISVGAIVCLSATMSCIVCNTNAPFIVVVITALGVGTICGAVNGFILTKFQELPPMIVTLATQIIFRGISEIVLGSGGSISASNTDGFRAIGGKIGNVNYLGSGTYVTVPRVEWGVGMGHKQINGGLMPGGRLRMEKLGALVAAGKLDVHPLASHVFEGWDHLEEALFMMRDKPADLIKPVVKISD